MGRRGHIFSRREAAKIARTVNRVNRTFPEIGTPRQGLPGAIVDDYVSISVKNTTGSVLNPFSIVMIERDGASENIQGDTYNLGYVVWEATAPTLESGESVSDKTFAVLQAEVQPNGVGTALITGVTKLRLDDTAKGNLAQPVDGDIDKMITDDTGMYPVLYVAESGSDDTWGYVALVGSVGASLEEITVVTAVRLDSDKLQYKTRVIQVVVDAEESDWIDGGSISESISGENITVVNDVSWDTGSHEFKQNKHVTVKVLSATAATGDIAFQSTKECVGS